MQEAASTRLTTQYPIPAIPGYNGNRVDMGAYGNTRSAPQQPPLDQMAITLEAASPTQVGQPSQMISYTVTLKNSGTVNDNYRISVKSNNADFKASLYRNGRYDEILRTPNLVPQEQTSITVWATIPLIPFLDPTQIISVTAIGEYGVQETVVLTTQILSFQEVSGQVVVEADHFARQIERSGRSWLTQTVLSGFSGTGYMSALPDTDRLFTTTYSSPALHYPISFTTTGTYTVWLRGYAPNSAGDSLYVALDDQPVAILTGFTPWEWGWVNKNTFGGIVTIEVTTPGFHILYLWQREDGLRLDRILLTTDSGYNPDGNGPPESEIR